MAHFLAIDADARGLFVAAGTVRNGAATVDRTAHAADAPPLSPGTAAELGAALKALLKEASIRPAPVLLCLGRDRVILKDVRHPPAPPAEEPAVVRFQALRDLSESPDDVVMDYTPLPPLPGGEKRASAVFARTEVVAAARAFADAAGLRLAAITPRPFVVADLFRRVDAARTADGAHALLTLWPGGGELTVARGRDVLFSRAVSQAAAADERVLAAELKRNLTVYAGQNPAEPLAAVSVAEPDAGREGLADRLGDLFPVPFRKLDPLAGSAAADGVAAGLHGRFAGPVGLLAAQASPAALAINFTAPRQPRADANPHRPRILVGALLGVAALAAAVVVGVVQTETAAGRLKLALAEKQAVDDELKRLEADAKRLEAADEFVNREVVWLDELYDVADRVPDVSQVKLVEFDGSSIIPPAAKGTGPRPGPPAPGVAPGGPPKPAKPAPVGHLKLVVTTEAPVQVDRITDSFARDGRFYAGTRRIAQGLAGGTSGARAQKFVVETDVLHRPPADFTRKLPVSAPPKPAAGGGGMDGGFMFGGFGGAGQ